MLKVDLRKQLLNLREELHQKLPKEQWGEAQLGLLEDFLQKPREEWHREFTVAGYIPFRSELQLMGPWAEHWMCPRVVKQDMMWFSYGDGVMGYKKNRFGIPEKDISVCVEDLPMPLLVLAPGVACNHSGFRVGYGGGFYDRFLENKREDCRVIFLTVDELLITENFQESHDIPVDIIVTQSKVIDISIKK